MASKKTASKSKLKTIIIQNNEEHKIPKSFTGIVKIFKIDPRTKEKYFDLLSYYKKGKRHRLDGPATIRADGTKLWFKKGNLHREGGPAIEYEDGYKAWWIEGSLHREDGPAIICTNGTKKWYKEGLLHREDGPAIESVDGTKEWYLEGEEYSENQWKMKLKGEEPIPTPVSKVPFIPKDPDPLGLNPAPVKKFYPSFMEVRSRDIQPLPPPKKEFNLTSWSQYGIDWS